MLQGALEFDALEGRLAQLESELLELSANSDRLHRSYNELLELQVGLCSREGRGCVQVGLRSREGQAMNCSNELLQ